MKLNCSLLNNNKHVEKCLKITQKKNRKNCINKPKNFNNKTIISNFRFTSFVYTFKSFRDVVRLKKNFFTLEIASRI